MFIILINCPADYCATLPVRPDRVRCGCPALVVLLIPIISIPISGPTKEDDLHSTLPPETEVFKLIAYADKEEKSCIFNSPHYAEASHVG